MSREEMEAAVAASPLLAGCVIPTGQMKVKTCRKGQMVNDRQKGQAILGLIVKGEVDAYSIAMDGREILLSNLKPGDCFGIINLLTDTELPTVLRCRSDTTLLMIPKDSVVEAMLEDHRLALRYAQICGRKLQFLLQRIEFLTMQSVRKKLIQYILLQPEGPDGRLALTCPKEELAALLGISRASLFRELAKLEEEGVISREDGHILVLGREKLEQLLYE